ncbi:hypothetical protein H4582DRAFT_2061432 [Lactarius indigo]|nr:hypothetical protein H4582DRAFT_2061432 [Lactarius indigo]
MSSSHQASSSSTPNFQQIFEKALKDYKKKTGTNLTAHPLAAEINGCDSPESILAVLQGKVNELDQTRSNDDRITKWLDPTVNVLNALSSTIGEGAGSAFPPTKIIFSGIGILLVAAKSTATSRDVLVELFERIESLFQCLKTYTEVPPTQAVMDVLVKIMAEVLSVLAIATKGVKERRTKTILKKLAGVSEIEDALQRFRKLEQGELLTVIAQVLRETKSDAKQTDGMATETVKRMDARDSSSLDEEVRSPEEPPSPIPSPSHPGSWRSVHERGEFRRMRKTSEAHSSGPVIETPMRPPPGPPPERSQTVDSWGTWQGKFPPQPHGLFGPRSPRSSNEALSLDEPPEPPRFGAWESVHAVRKPEAWPRGRPAWATWKVQSDLEHTPPESPPELFIPRLPRSSIEELPPTSFRTNTRRPVKQRRVFKRASEKLEDPTGHVVEAQPPGRVRRRFRQATLQAPTTPGGLSPRSSIDEPPAPLQPRDHLGPRSPRSSIEEFPAPVRQQRVFTRPHKKSEAHSSGGISETPMYTPPAQPPGRMRRRACNLVSMHAAVQYTHNSSSRYGIDTAKFKETPNACTLGVRIAVPSLENNTGANYKTYAP